MPVSIEKATDIYISHLDKPYGSDFADVVGRFQEGFLSDCVCTDLDESFAKAVDTAVRMLPAIKARNA